jgi:hypothetical protein
MSQRIGLLCSLVLLLAYGTAAVQVREAREVEGSSSSSHAPYPKGWINLFEPPFENCPTIMMAISCLHKHYCYIPGGQNGGNEPFDVFIFDGEVNGNFQPMNMPSMTVMMLGITVGGTVTHPHGAVGGFGILNGVQYMVNATTWLPSKGPWLIVTQDMRSTNGGKDILVIDQVASNQNQVLYSSDAGKTFLAYNVNVETPTNYTFLRYGAIVSEKVWYLTMGNWPARDNGYSAPTKDKFHQSERVHFTRSQEGKWTRHARNFVKEEAELGSSAGSSSSASQLYTAVIAKTLDGGKTFHNVFYDSSDFVFNGIDCISSIHCIAVGEGFNQNAAGHVYLTTDGRIFRRTLHLLSNATGRYSLVSVRFNGPHQAWVAGSYMTQEGSRSIVYYTNDGGHTWTQHRSIDYIVDITDMTFLPDGTGFATAITTFDSSTILRYDPVGPPQTPAPTWSGNITQIQCDDDNCQINCTTISIPQNQCLQMNGGGSAIAQCQPGILMQTVFPLTTNCQGPSGEDPAPLNQCQQAQQGSYENFCGPTSDPLPPRSHGLLRRQRRQPIP